jgi:hypothetical protein
MTRAESSPRQSTAKEKKATLMVISLYGGSQSCKSVWKYFFAKCLNRPPVKQKNKIVSFQVETFRKRTQ